MEFAVICDGCVGGWCFNHFPFAGFPYVMRRLLGSIILWVFAENAVAQTTEGEYVFPRDKEKKIMTEQVHA